ncbi:MAG: radical SAM protein [Bacteroidales bacterium]|nr:radical SAM protein [Bacteroidales bacterium]
MSTFLFNSIIFGPVWSRRLGESLGVNLLPVNRKTCNFNCIYCECGLTPDLESKPDFPSRHHVLQLLRKRLIRMKEENLYLNSITFAGNGEPTLHPEFPEILNGTIPLRDEFFPETVIAVLSNATMIGNERIFNALLQADLSIMKLDSANAETLRKINCPRGSFNLNEIVDRLCAFNGNVTIQTLFFRGFYNNFMVDNTTEKEIEEWLKVLQKIRPENVMIYSIARDTAVPGLEKIDQDELYAIAHKVEQLGIQTQVNP